LKGSKTSRFTKRGQGKDVNFGDRKIKVSSNAYNELTQAIRRDANFLCEQKIMDYSLLIGIHDCSEARGVESIINDFEVVDPDIPVPLQTRRGFGSIDLVPIPFYHSPQGEEIYFLGIIDFFQRYTFTKRAERQWKLIVYCQNPDDLSVMPVEPYRDRFIRQMIDHFEISEQKI